jgi:hypothetical protein
MNALETLHRLVAEQFRPVDFEMLEAMPAVSLPGARIEGAVDGIERNATWCAASKFVGRVAARIGRHALCRMDETAARWSSHSIYSLLKVDTIS